MQPIATSSDAVWELSFSEAEDAGCAFPAEPAGVSIRLLLDEGHLVTKWKVAASVTVAVAKCDACYGYCTVPTTIKQISASAGTFRERVGIVTAENGANPNNAA